MPVCLLFLAGGDMKLSSYLELERSPQDCNVSRQRCQYLGPKTQLNTDCLITTFNCMLWMRKKKFNQAFKKYMTEWERFL